MSNIRKSDVKNHLSPRFCSKIHLCQPKAEPDAAGFPQEESARRDLIKNGSTESHLSSTNKRSPLLIVTPKSVQD